MQKTRKARIIPLAVVAIALSFSFYSSAAYAQIGSAVTISPQNTTSQTNRRVVVAPLPAQKNSFIHKASTETPSGYVVPRFVSLKFGKVNGRTGPSRDHSIAWQYRRRGLPLVVVAETEMWRKVRDINGDEAWVRKPALSGERFVLTMSETTLLAKPKLGSRPIASSEGGALMKLETCNPEGWCRVKAGNGLIGWTSVRSLWGAQAF